MVRYSRRDCGSRTLVPAGEADVGRVPSISLRGSMDSPFKKTCTGLASRNHMRAVMHSRGSCDLKAKTALGGIHSGLYSPSRLRSGLTGRSMS